MSRSSFAVVSALLVLCLLAPLVPGAKPGAGNTDEQASASPATYELLRHVIGPIALEATSENYTQTATGGQTSSGGAKSINYQMAQGFWPDFSPPGCCIGLTGNVDNDPADQVDLGDLTALIDYLFISFTEPECIEEANVDGDPSGAVDLGDLTALIDYLFISFTPPAECL